MGRLLLYISAKSAILKFNFENIDLVLEKTLDTVVKSYKCQQNILV